MAPSTLPGNADHVDIPRLRQAAYVSSLFDALYAEMGSNSAKREAMADLLWRKHRIEFLPLLTLAGSDETAFKNAFVAQYANAAIRSEVERQFGLYFRDLDTIEPLHYDLGALDIDDSWWTAGRQPRSGGSPPRRTRSTSTARSAADCPSPSRCIPHWCAGDFTARAEGQATPGEIGRGVLRRDARRHERDRQQEEYFFMSGSGLEFEFECAPFDEAQADADRVAVVEAAARVYFCSATGIVEIGSCGERVADPRRRDAVRRWRSRPVRPRW